MSYSPRYDRGNWKCYCDACGRLVKASELRQRWDGFMVDDKCWEPRQPQDFVRGVADIQTPPFTRPEPSNTFLPIIYVYTPDGTTPINAVQSVTSTSLTYKPVDVFRPSIVSTITTTLRKVLGKSLTRLVTSTATLTATLLAIVPQFTTYTDTISGSSSATSITLNKSSSSRFLLVALYTVNGTGTWSTTSPGWVFLYNTNGQALAYHPGSTGTSFTFNCSVAGKLLGSMTSWVYAANSALGSAVNTSGNYTNPVNVNVPAAAVSNNNSRKVGVIFAQSTLEDNTVTMRPTGEEEAWQLMGSVQVNDTISVPYNTFIKLYRYLDPVDYPSTVVRGETDQVRFTSANTLSAMLYVIKPAL